MILLPLILAAGFGGGFRPVGLPSNCAKPLSTCAIGGAPAGNPCAAPFACVYLLAGQVGICGEADGTGSAAGFNQPGQATYDGIDSVYLTDFDGTASNLRKVNVVTGAVTTININGGDFGPMYSGLAYADGGGTGAAALYGPDQSDDVVTIDLGTDTTTEFQPGWGLPTDAVYSFQNGANSFLFIPDNNGSIWRFDVPAFASPQTASVGGAPYGIALKNSTQVFWSDNSCFIENGGVWPLASPSTLVGSAGCGWADGNAATAKFGTGNMGLTYHSEDGFLYAADQGNNVVRKVNATNGTTTTIIGVHGNTTVSLPGPIGTTPIGYPTDVVWAGPGRFVIVDFVLCALYEWR